MRAREFMAENASAGATGAGSVATVSQPLGGMIARTATPNVAKYMNSFDPKKKRKQHARG